MAARQVLSIGLDDPSLKIVKADCAESGMARAEFIRRLLTWYASQNDITRGAIRGTLPQSVTPDLSKITFGNEPTYQNLVTSVGGPKANG